MYTYFLMRSIIVIWIQWCRETRPQNALFASEINIKEEKLHICEAKRSLWGYLIKKIGGGGTLGIELEKLRTVHSAPFSIGSPKVLFFSLEIKIYRGTCQKKKGDTSRSKTGTLVVLNWKSSIFPSGMKRWTYRKRKIGTLYQQKSEN